MTNQLQKFTNEEFGTIRAIEIHGTPWFVGKDVACALGYEAERNAIKKHVDDEDKLTHQFGASGQNRNMTIINESGLYSLILSSKLATAKKFKRWVTSEVLPSIRKHGAYLTDETLHNLLSDPELAHDLFCKLQDEREKTTQLEIRLETQAPKVQYYNTILQSKNAIPITLIAKDYGMSAMAFNQLLFDLGIQHKIGGTWILYQRYADSGYTQSRTYYTGKGRAVLHTCWTQKGRLFLYDTLAEYGIFPSTFAVH